MPFETTTRRRAPRRRPWRLAGLVACLSAALAGCEPVASEIATGRERSALEDGPEIELEALPIGPFAEGGGFLSGPWGNEEQAFGREAVGASTGPMAIAALADGGLAVLDTVGARVHRFDAQGGRRDAVPIGARTGDDLTALPDGGFAVLAYQRLPRPHHEVLAFHREGSLRAREDVPRAVSLPTALLADGGRLCVESRHRYVHPLDGSPWLSGRPAGDATVSARLAEGGRLLLAATDRTGVQRLWQRELSAERPITEVLALEVTSELIGVVLRLLDEGDVEEDEPGGQESWLVALDHEGRARGRLEVRDQRVTDANRPFALGARGVFYELVTTGGGLTVYRHSLGEGGAP